MKALLLVALMTQTAALAQAPEGAGAGASIIPRSESVDSVNYTVSNPRVRASGDAFHVDGEVCRRANRSGLSPAQVRIEHLDASGQVVETTNAFLPSLSWREDQRCGHYGASLKQPAQPGDVVRACIARKACTPH